MNENLSKRKKGVKAMMLELNKGETFVLPRKRYSTAVSTKSIAKIENPDRDWEVRVIPDGILVECLK